MDRPLHLLIVDDRPESVFLLSEFLLKRHHRVEVSSDMREALGATLRRRGHGDPYDLVIANACMPQMSGIELLRDLRGRNDPTMVALLDAFGDLDAQSYREAEALGCATFLDKPIDLGRVERLLAVVTTATGGSGSGGGSGGGGQPRAASQSYRRTDSQIIHGSEQFTLQPVVTAQVAPKPVATTAYQRTPSSAQLPGSDAHVRNTTTTRRAKPQGEEPFFGTAKIVRPVGGSTERTPKPLTPNPFSGVYTPATKQPDPFAAKYETSRTRRSVSSVMPPGSLGAPPPKPGGDSAPPQHPGSGSGSRDAALERRVLCAACRKEFVVAHRAQEFTVNCMHCGQLNRVQPRPMRG
ncbi:MAG TPA: response regulator [Planctomycetota bacterium]|nr:response regulator [Planctomycetota bacterium]